MTGIAALFAFFLAFLFHGFKFAPDLWWNWQGLVLAGLVFLTLYIMGLGTGFPVTIRR